MDKRLNVVTKFSYELGKVGGDIRKTDCILSPDGTLYIVNRINAKSSKNDYRPKRYIITAVSRDGQTVSTPLTDLPEGLIDNLVWKAEKNILSFVGLLSRSEKENYTVILSGEFNSSQKKVSNLKQSMINDSPFWQNAAGYLQDCQKGIGTDKELVSSISGDNGSVTLVLLKTDYTVIFRGNYSTVRSNASDAFVVKINRNGELDWLQFVSFGQVELSEPAYSGVIATSPNKKDLFLFFQDDSSNHNIPPGGSYSTITFPNSWPKAADLAVVHITESGVLSRKSADQAKDPHFHLAGHLPYLVVGNEITYTSFFYINAGGSKYRPGSIKITLP
jgi:hypothetical protein